MEVLPIDVTAIVSVIVGGLFILIPTLGLTARFALRPIVEAIARVRETQHSGREHELLEQRIALLEQQLQNIDMNVERLLDKKEFDHQLAAGGES